MGPWEHRENHRGAKQGIMGIRGVFTESLIPIGIWQKVIIRGG